MEETPWKLDPVEGGYLPSSFLRDLAHSQFQFFRNKGKIYLGTAPFLGVKNGGVTQKNVP